MLGLTIQPALVMLRSSGSGSATCDGTSRSPSPPPKGAGAISLYKTRSCHLRLPIRMPPMAAREKPQ